MATHSSVLAWRIPGMGEPAVYGVAQSRTRLKRLSSSSSCWCQASLAHLSEGSVQAQENLIASK